MFTYQVTPPTVSCFALSCAEAHRRIQAAEDAAIASGEKYNKPNSANHYGSEIIWHPAFGLEYVAVVSGTPLHEMAAWSENVDKWANDNTPLDFFDYGYLADMLREGLASQPTPLAALRLARALALVEQAGAALLPTAQLHPTASQPEAAPALAA